MWTRGFLDANFLSIFVGCLKRNARFRSFSKDASSGTLVFVIFNSLFKGSLKRNAYLCSVLDICCGKPQAKRLFLYQEKAYVTHRHRTMVVANRLFYIQATPVIVVSVAVKPVARRCRSSLTSPSHVVRLALDCTSRPRSSRAVVRRLRSLLKFRV